MASIFERVDGNDREIDSDAGDVATAAETAKALVTEHGGTFLVFDDGHDRPCFKASEAGWLWLS